MTERVKKVGLSVGLVDGKDDGVFDGFIDGVDVGFKLSVDGVVVRS